MRGKGACNHQDKAPCFKVVMGDKGYHYPDEPSAVMFALRYSRDLKQVATVYDPNGKVIVEFQKRQYDVAKMSELARGYWRNDELQMEIARSHAERKAGGTSEEEAGSRRIKKAAHAKDGGKEVSRTRSIKRTKR